MLKFAQHLLGAGLLLAPATGQAAGTAPEPRALPGPEIISLFAGVTITGAYADATPFRESYAAEGTLSYWDPRGPAAGQWSVVNNLFCTFYDSLAGGCFRIEQVGANCFDFYAAASSEQEAATTPDQKPRYTARGSIAGKPSTCPDQLQV